MNFQRYALYYTAEPGDFADFGARWLGWDLVSGRPVAQPEFSQLPLPLNAITKTPRKYGFHATIKPPFRLADGASLAALRDQARDLCAREAPVTLNGLKVSRLGSFLALTPTGPVDALNSMAARMVEGLDRFRATASAAELEKRRAGGLTEVQERNLQRWGYPYVMEAFNFHMTLSGRLSPETRDAVAALLDRQLAEFLLSPFTIADMTLVGEARDGQFHAIERYAFRAI